MMDVSKNIVDLVPYKPGKPISETQREFGLDDVVKLASNENALGPSPKAVEAMQDYLKNIHLYPDASCYELKNKVSGITGLDTNQISFGNGSNEIIDLLIRIFCNPGDKILTGKSAFIAYKICAQVSQVETHEVPLLESMQFDIKAMGEIVKSGWTKQHKIIFMPNPNNPTGTYINKTDMDEFVNLCKGRDDLILVFDEAYNEFVRAKDYPKAIDYLKENDNVVIIRTLSKAYGLGGMRIGYLLAHPQYIDYFNRIRNPFNVNSLAQVGALAALDDKDYLKESQEIVWSGLDYFYSEFEKMNIKYVVSQGNFVLFDTGKAGSEVAHEALKRGVILRPVGGYGLANYLRISVGLELENKRAIEVLKEILL